jgi:hypothetical protein
MSFSEGKRRAHYGSSRSFYWNAHFSYLSSDSRRADESDLARLGDVLTKASQMPILQDRVRESAFQQTGAKL